MRGRVTLNHFWAGLLIALVGSQLLNIYIFYKSENAHHLDTLKSSIKVAIEDLHYHLALDLDTKELQSSQNFLEIKTQLNDTFSSLSIVSENTIILSSHPQMLNKNLESMSALSLKQFLHLTNIEDFSRVLLIPIKSYTHATTYYLLIQLNTDHITQNIQSSLAVQMFYSGVGALLLFGIVVLFFTLGIARPLRQIVGKIAQHDVTPTPFVLREMHQLDSALMEAFETIRDRQMLLDSVINSTDDLIFFKDEHFVYLGCNSAFSAFVGKPKEYIIGKNDFDLFDKTTATLFREMDTLMLAKRTPHTNNEWVTYPNQRKVYMQTLKAPLEYAEHHFGLVGIGRDITQTYEIQQKLKEQAYLDELTKIGNRKAFVKHLKELLGLYKRYANTFSLLMYDIDDFKQVNDTYGHAVGDEVLVGIAHAIAPIIREHDGHYRVGGEEFVILFPQTPLEQALPVAQKIRQAVEKLHIIEERAVTISIGVAQVNPEDTFETLFARADTLLYKAKHQGKNSVCS